MKCPYCSSEEDYVGLYDEGALVQLIHFLWGPVYGGKNEMSIL
ncbi:MAG: hypothetical protein WC614_06670 [bacterium]